VFHSASLKRNTATPGPVRRTDSQHGAGNLVGNADVQGKFHGKVSDMALHAHLAMYKVGTR
jgi:hypothetical protein